MRRELIAIVAVVGSAAGSARADETECLQQLDALGVAYERVSRNGIATGVRVTGELGGVRYEAYSGKPLILDCSLVYSLAHAGRFLAAAGVERVTYSSAYSIRNIRGTSRPSSHSFGLAIDVHSFHTADAVFVVRDDYEQGLGDNVDCVGDPLTRGGALLRTLACQLSRSELFRIVLTPDYDAGHYNHYHLEALPWDERQDVSWRARDPGRG